MQVEAFYTSYIMRNISRVLTQVDRDKDSKTYGSCDRNYWHLKIRDFSSAILQQTCLTLALMYNVEFEGNVYYKNANMREWAIASARYLGKIQLRDGSFNEYYPNEHGFPPTAFVLFSVCKTYQELNLDDKGILHMLDKAAAWLMKHEERNAYNQEAAAIAGLYFFYKITNREDVLNVVHSKLDNLLIKQSAEGWFPEQGGADIGYSSVTLDMLTEYYWASGDTRVKEAICRLQDFLSYFVHPDGTIGGEYGSRNTIYFMPNGLEAMVHLGLDNNNSAQSMIQMIYGKNPNSEFGDFMDAVDERYLTHYVMHSYLRARQKFRKREMIEVALPFNTRHYKIFKDAGLITQYNGTYYLVCSTHKGGNIKVYRNDKEIYWDCGYRILVKEGTTAATNWLSDDYIVEYTSDGCNIAGNFHIVTPKVQNTIYHLGLRVMAVLLGDKVNRLVKKITIFQNKKFEASFERKLIFDHDKIIIIDNIKNPKNYDVREASNVSLRLVASGKFFSKSDVLRTDLIDYGNSKEISSYKVYNVGEQTLKTKIN